MCGTARVHMICGIIHPFEMDKSIAPQGHADSGGAANGIRVYMVTYFLYGTLGSALGAYGWSGRERASLARGNPVGSRTRCVWLDARCGR